MKNLLIILALFVQYSWGQFNQNPCYCDGGYVQQCTMEGELSKLKELFTGTCNENNKKIFGLTQFQDGSSWYGNYHENSTPKEGEYTYARGDKLRGQITPDQTKFTGKLIQGKFSQTGFYDNTASLLLNGFAIVDNGKDIQTEVAIISGNYSIVRQQPVIDGVAFLKSYLRDWEAYGNYKKGKASGFFYYLYGDGGRKVERYRNNKLQKTTFEFTSEDNRNMESLKQRYLKDLNTFKPIFDEIEKKVSGLLNSDKEENQSHLRKKRDETLFLIQEMLSKLGYDPGLPDGLIGVKTTSAIKAFQLDNNLEMSGEYGEDLLIYIQSAIRKQKTN